MQNFRPAGSLQYFLKNWEKLTNDPFILELVKGYQIPFLSELSRTAPPSAISMSQKEIAIVDQEIQEMLKKDAVKLVQHSTENQFLSSIFIVPKKDSGHRSVINLRKLNKHIPYIHFKMEGPFFLKEILLKGDYMCKIDLKDAYFSVLLNRKSQKFVSFKWKDLIYQFLCLCFAMGPAPRIFTKLMKVPISLMRKLNVRLIIFLDDILLMAASVEELTLARGTLIYLLQNLGFLINIKKSVLQPCQTIQFLGMEINSIDMTVTLPQEKKDQIVKQCQDLLRKSSVSIRELTQLIVKAGINSHCSSASTTPISSNAMQANIGVICSRRLQLRNKTIRQGEDRTAMVGTESSLKQWEVSYILPSPVTNSLRCIFRRLRCILSRTQNRGTMDITREKRSYKYFRTDSSKICNFTRLHPTAKTIHIKMDNIVALSYLVNMGGTRNQLLVQINKEIWEYLLDKGITITAEYLPGALNREADMESRTVKDSSEWKLNPVVFQNLCKSWWTPDIDLFASRVSHQVPAYVSWKLDPYSKGRDAFQTCWTHTKGYAFPHFL